MNFDRFRQKRAEQRIEESGEFPCPHCRTDREYTLIAMREIRGLFGKFLLDSGDILDTFVDCRTCGNRYPGTLRDHELFRDRAERHRAD